MSYPGMRPQNHPHQVATNGPLDCVDDRALPFALFERHIQRRYHLSIDVAASAGNAKLPRFYTMRDDGLSRSWAGERVYCNPPFSNITPWVEKAWSETTARIVVMLLPANRTEQAWWQELIEPFRDKIRSPLKVEFLPGRIRFVKPNTSLSLKGNRPPFACCLCVWHHGASLFSDASSSHSS